MGALRTLVLSTALAMGSSLLLGLLSLPLLKHNRFKGEYIREFGGLLPLFSALVGLLCFGGGGQRDSLLLLLLCLLFAGAGYYDRGRAMLHKKGLGLTPLTRWLLLGLLSLLAALFLSLGGYGFILHWLYIPLAGGLCLLSLLLMPTQEEATESYVSLGAMGLLTLGLLFFLFTGAAPLQERDPGRLRSLCALLGGLLGGLLGFGVYEKKQGLKLGLGGLYALFGGLSIACLMLPKPELGLLIYLLPLYPFLKRKLPAKGPGDSSLLLGAMASVLTLLLYLL